MGIRRRFEPSGVCVTRGIFACCLLVPYLPRCGAERRARGQRCGVKVSSLPCNTGTEHGSWGFSDRAIPILADLGWCLEEIVWKNLRPAIRSYGSERFLENGQVFGTLQLGS